MPERGGYAGYGMCIGLCLGLSVGLACGQMVIGMAAGAAFAAQAEKIEQLRARQTVYFLELKERDKRKMLCKDVVSLL